MNLPSVYRCSRCGIYLTDEEVELWSNGSLRCVYCGSLVKQSNKRLRNFSPQTTFKKIAKAGVADDQPDEPSQAGGDGYEINADKRAITYAWMVLYELMNCTPDAFNIPTPTCSRRRLLECLNCKLMFVNFSLFKCPFCDGQRKNFFQGTEKKLATELAKIEAVIGLAKVYRASNKYRRWNMKIFIPKVFIEHGGSLTIMNFDGELLEGYLSTHRSDDGYTFHFYKIRAGDGCSVGDTVFVVSRR